MPKTVLFSQEINELITKNADIFMYEYPDIVSEKDWNDFKTKPNCKCRKKIMDGLLKDMTKFNQIVSKLKGEEIEIIFPKPLEETIVEEFETLKEMEVFLKELKNKGIMFRSATPSPNGKGGFILIVL